MNKNYLFTSESVTEGHPDKIADQISDAVLDAILEQDPYARVACETAVNTGLVLVFGEITTTAYVDIQTIVRETVRDIGYTNFKYGFDADNIAVLVSIDEQSPDIAQGVNDALESRDSSDQALIGAGDQGLMFGYAINDTKEYIPMSVLLSHKLAERLTFVRKEGIIPYLGPDGKTQVTFEFDEHHNPIRIDSIVISAQHAEDASLEQVRKDIIEHVVRPVVFAKWLDENTKYYINPTGKFVIGGPVGDSGLTGRKIIVDTYGGVAHHGGGAFSGKDATKVDRSASYAARYIAKNLVAAGVAGEIEIQLAYAIGVAEPMNIYINTFNTANYPEERIIQLIRDLFDLTPEGIINMLDLRKPRYRKTAAYGHFGRNLPEFTWERLDKVELIQSYLNA